MPREAFTPDDDEDLFDPVSPVTAPPRPKPSNKIVYQPAGAQWSLNRLPEVQSLYQSSFNKPLPLAVRGQGSAHNRLGFDHRSSADVSINPASAEGQQFLEQLRRANVPFLAFNSAIPGVATGPHVHLGFPSHRTQRRFNVGSQKKSQGVASDDLFDQDRDLFDTPQQPPGAPNYDDVIAAAVSGPEAKLPKTTSRVIESDTGDELRVEASKPITFSQGQFPSTGARLTGVDELKRQRLLEAPPQSQILSGEYTANLGHEGGNQHALSKAALRTLGLNEQLADIYAQSTGRPLLTITNAQPDREGNFRFSMPKQTVDFLNAWASGLAEGGVDEGLRRAAAVNLAGREDVKHATETAQQAAAQDVTEAEAATKRGVESPFIRGVTSGAAPVAQAIGTVLPESLGDFERKARVLRAAGEQADIERPLTGTGEQIKAGLGAAVPTAMEFAVTGPLKAAQLPVLGALGGFTPEERAQGALTGAVTQGTFALPGMLAPNITGTAEKILAGTTAAAVPTTEAAIRGESIPRAIAESLPYAALPFLHSGREPESVTQRITPESARLPVDQRVGESPATPEVPGAQPRAEAQPETAQRGPTRREQLIREPETAQRSATGEPSPQLIADADERFIQSAMDRAGLTRDAAAKVLALYKNENIVKFDPSRGELAYEQSAFAEPDAMRRVAMVGEATTKATPDTTARQGLNLISRSRSSFERWAGSFLQKCIAASWTGCARARLARRASSISMRGKAMSDKQRIS